LPREINQQWGGSAPPFQQRNIQMDIKDKLQALDKKIAKLNKQKAALRAEAIEHDFAYYVQTTRDIAPNLSWWKENRPQSWQRFTSTTTVNKFTWK
jgi:hypothetical protein